MRLRCLLAPPLALTWSRLSHSKKPNCNRSFFRDCPPSRQSRRLYEGPLTFNSARKQTGRNPHMIAVPWA